MSKLLDDSQLLRLASEPRTRLFPPLRGATVFGPLVFLAGLFPCLAAVLGGELSDSAGGWALRALDLPTAVELQSWLEPGRRGLGSAFVHQPPLSTWLLALATEVLGPDRSENWRVSTLVFECFAVWAMYLLGRRIGGASFGLVVAVMLCVHPVMLQLATGTSPAAGGMFWIAIAVWGFLGHLEGPAQLVSMRMLAGSVAWGLALLSVGPVAVALFVPMLIQAWLLHEGRHVADQNIAARVWQLWLGMRALAIFVLTAVTISGWWHLMMLTNYGGEFWNSWWLGKAPLNFPLDSVPSFWREWLLQNTFLCGWLFAGLVSALNELRRPTTELTRRRCQFVIVWWLTALSMRAIFDIPDLRRSALIDAWDAMLLLPSILLAGWGIKSVVMRLIPLAGEAMLVVATVGLSCWRITTSPWLGWLAAVVCLVVMALLPIMTPRIRWGPRRWTEREWRQLMRIAFVMIFAGNIVTAIAQFPRISAESRSLTDLRNRIAPVSDIPRVTLNGPVPESVLFVIRSHFPTSQFVIALPRDGKTIRDSAPLSELVVEWTRYEVRITNELPASRQATAIGDPLRFRGRRLMLYLVGPRQR